jgi:hypothetical protein
VILVSAAGVVVSFFPAILFSPPRFRRQEREKKHNPAPVTLYAPLIAGSQDIGRDRVAGPTSRGVTPRPPIEDPDGEYRNENFAPGSELDVLSRRTSTLDERCRRELREICPRRARCLPPPSAPERDSTTRPMNWLRWHLRGGGSECGGER